MATISRSLSARIDGTGKAEILLRLNIDRNTRHRIKSGIFISASRFRNGEIVKPRANRIELTELEQIETELIKLERHIISLCQCRSSDEITQKFIAEELDKYRHPEKHVNSKLSFFDAFNEYIDKSGLSTVRLNNYKVLLRALYRYELFKRITNKKFRLSFENIDDNALYDFIEFLKAEPELFDEYPDLYAEMPAITRTMRKPKRPLPRGENTLTGILKRFRAFYNWSIKKGYTDNYPFKKITIKSENYGTPYFITLEERNLIADFDLSMCPALAVQRDIFIFQCLMGCRVGDLMRLTKSNIIDGAVEYVPGKTMKKNAETLRVPLLDRAAAILERYKDVPGERLLPFISSQRYNDAIKSIFTKCDITRAVTVLNPTTGKEEQRPLNEIASSHIARRTFVGNLYKKVADPNLIGKLSGHKEGSKAFVRYRDIDEEMKRETINLLD